MNKEKLVCVIMGQNCEKFIGMCLDSVKDTDAIVYCDGGSTDGTREIISEAQDKSIGHTIDWIENPYNQEDKEMNGKQRNFYLNYIKAEFPDYWCLCLDADEVVEDLGKAKEFIQSARLGLYSVKMRHFIGDMGHEDSTVEKHWVPNRLFKISEADFYPEVEHPTLQPKYQHDEIINDGSIITLRLPETGKCAYIGQTDCTTIWHLAYIPNMWEIKKRYDNHLKKSNMHTPEFLKQWYYWHLFGQYPKKKVEIIDIPSIILKEFGIDKDEFYFAQRGIDMKHPLMVKQFNDYFNPESVLDLGAGRGPYLYFWKWFIKEAKGIELSQWAVDHAFCSDIMQGDIATMNVSGFDLVTAIDVLEHLDDIQLERALVNISEAGNKFLFSIPFVGNPDLLNDKTHKQFKTKEEWIKIIESHGIKIKETPKEWHFAHQLLVGVKE